MGRCYSLDLRRRVVARVASGRTRRGAANDLDVSPSFSVKLVAQHQRTGCLDAAPQGRPPGAGKLSPYSDFLLGRVKERPDITMPELAAELATRHGIEANPASLSRFLCKAGISFKKNTAGQRTRAF